MAQQDGGWPLGLQPLSVRVGLIRNSEFSGSSSFSTVITASPRASSAATSDFDAESAGSFYHDRSITLGSLIGISSFLELSFRSLGKSRKEDISRGKKSHRTKTCFSLCLRAHLVKGTAGNAPSLGHYLEVERRSSNVHRRSRSTPVRNSTLFSDGFVVPSRMNGGRSLAMAPGDGERRCNKDLRDANGFVSSLLHPCMGWRSRH